MFHPVAILAKPFHVKRLCVVFVVAMYPTARAASFALAGLKFPPIPHGIIQNYMRGFFVWVLRIPFSLSGAG